MFPNHQATTLQDLDHVWTPSSNLHEELQLRWDGLWSPLGLQSRGGLFETMIARWCEPARKYHTAQHLLECLRMFEVLRAYCERPDLVELALWYHDAVYEPATHDNEEKSAELARSTLQKSGGNPADAEELRKLVMATQHGLPVRTPDAAVVVDCDLAILGAPTWRFDEYEGQVRAEYSFVPAGEFARGRLRAIGPFLARKTIFRTPLLRNLIEQRAQDNLARAVGRLQKSQVRG